MARWSGGRSGSSACHAQGRGRPRRGAGWPAEGLRPRGRKPALGTLSLSLGIFLGGWPCAASTRQPSYEALLSGTSWRECRWMGLSWALPVNRVLLTPSLVPAGPAFLTSGTLGWVGGPVGEAT